VIRDRVLSRAQLETLVHALDATSILPAAIACQNAGLNWCPMLKAPLPARLLPGDGTGAGKGRQLASILMDQWLRGTAAISGSARAMP
jgi:hypothetical protein